MHFDFEQFAHFLVNGRKITEEGKRIYVGTVSEKQGDLGSKLAMTRQTAFFSRLIQDKWQLKTSNLKERTEELVIDYSVYDYQKIRKLGIEKIKFQRLREKGIDVKLATDLIVGAVDDKYDVAIVVSSDSDLVPAIDWIRQRKKKQVEYIGFSIPDEINPLHSTKPLLALIKKTDMNRILVKSDLQQFIRPDHLSYLMGVKNLSDRQLKEVGVKIESKNTDGDRTIKVPEEKLSGYIEIVKDSLNPGFWNEIIGAKKIVFIFKFKDGVIREYKLSPNNEKEISKLCTQFNNDPIEKTANVYKYISENKFYHDFMVEHYSDLINRAMPEISK